jgi:hypothetical protein
MITYLFASGIVRFATEEDEEEGEWLDASELEEGEEVIEIVDEELE